MVATPPRSVCPIIYCEIESNIARWTDQRNLAVKLTQLRNLSSCYKLQFSHPHLVGQDFILPPFLLGVMAGRVLPYRFWKAGHRRLFFVSGLLLLGFFELPECGRAAEHPPILVNPDLRGRLVQHEQCAGWVAGHQQ